MTDQLMNGTAAADAATDHPMLELLDAMEDNWVFRRGDVVSGSVAHVTDQEILIDVGGKSEGLLSPREFSRMSRDELAEYAVGDDVECLVVNPNDREGNLILSIKKARIGQDWEEAEQLHTDGKCFESSVDGHNKGGLIVYIGQVRGFIPASQIDRSHAIKREEVDGSPNSPLARFVGRPIFVKVIEIDRHKNRLILSELAAMRERRKQSKAQLIDDLSEGTIIDGKVTSLADFGAFVDVGGADGLVHLSELSWNRVDHPSEVLDLGQKVQVKVISVDRERRRIGLSMKQLMPEPWSTVEDRFTVGDLVPAEITRITDFGAFARLDDDIEGLVHVSELSDQELPPGDVVESGQELTLRVIRIDPDRRRIGLSLKRVDPAYDELVANAELEAEAEAGADEAADVEAGGIETADVETADVEAADVEAAADTDATVAEADAETAAPAVAEAEAEAPEAAEASEDSEDSEAEAAETDGAPVQAGAEDEEASA